MKFQRFINKLRTQRSTAQGLVSTGEISSGLIRGQDTTKTTHSILHGCNNFTINNDNFINVSDIVTKNPLDALYRRVAANAILNAGGRADDVRCHPGTRIEVISGIESWRTGQDSSTVPIFWLVGYAGTGKSAIIQTLAESWSKQDVPQANFFFFRGDATRSTLSPVIATLLHQLILLYPPLANAVAAVLSDHPLIFESNWEDQLARLIVAPLLKIQESLTSYRKPTLLIDGLDEYVLDGERDQRQILVAFDKVMATDYCPFQLLVASRGEPWIQAAFETMSTPFRSFDLNDTPGAENDIRAFVNYQFQLIKQIHPLAHTIEDETWPSPQDVAGIVQKSSGQFMYAATAMRRIMYSSSSPVVSLKQLQNPEHNTANNPSTSVTRSKASPSLISRLIGRFGRTREHDV